MYLANLPSLIRRQSSKPSRFGIIQSVMTKLISSRWRISHAWTPSDAGTTSYPHRWRVCRSSLRISASSSTIRIRIASSYHRRRIAHDGEVPSNNNSVERAYPGCNRMKGLVGLSAGSYSRAPSEFPGVLSYDREVKPLEGGLDMVEEGAGVGAVDQAVIVGEAEVGHRTDGDHVIDNDRSFHHLAQAQDSRLRLYDDRCADHRAERTEVVDREGPVMGLLQTEPLVARPCGQVGQLFGQGQEALLIRLSQYRDNETLVQCHSDPDVDRTPDNDPLSRKGGVHQRTGPKGIRRCLD